MAGRYLILEFEDSDAATVLATNPHMPDQLGFKITGMFMKPKSFCQCPDKRRQTVQNWAKGKRTGMYICKVCKKPSEFHERGVLKRLQYVFGYNLLGDKDD